MYYNRYANGKCPDCGALLQKGANFCPTCSYNRKDKKLSNMLKDKIIPAIVIFICVLLVVLKAIT